MDLNKIQELTKDLQKIEKKMNSKKAKFNEEIEMLELEFEEKSDELTKYLNL